MSLEAQIDQWRQYVRRRQAIHAVDVAELEDHLREQVDGLVDAGLSSDEAFLVAVKRLGALDDLSREFAREHSERLWKQLVLPTTDSVQAIGRTDAVVAFGLAIVAALMIKLPVVFGVPFNDGNEGFYLRNLSLFVLPLLTGYFAWKRQLAVRTGAMLGACFLAGAVLANVFPFPLQSVTGQLTGLHLPIALWLVVGVAYCGNRWQQVAGRMDFIRFTGELVIYFGLIGMGGVVFMAFMAMIFKAIGLNVQHLLGEWLVPGGAMGAVIVAAWLVEAKQSVIENMAPVLTRLFTPFFAILLVSFLGTVAFTGRGVGIQREVLIAFDLLLAAVVGLVLYSISARDPDAPPGPFDVLLVVLVASALLVDGVALWAVGTRITEMGFTPNRVAALGENLILLVNLSWSLVLCLCFVRGKGPLRAVETWQTNYLPVYALWATLVVAAFPPLFHCI